MHECLLITSGMLLSELEAVEYLCQKPLTEKNELLVAKTFSAGFEQVYHLNREMMLLAFDQEMADATAGIKV